VLIGKDRTTLLWKVGSRARVLVRQPGYFGDLSADVVASFTNDPYQGGCSVVRRVSTGERLWKSCKERVTAVNPKGTRIATIDLLSDGLGPTRVWARKATGKLKGVYDIRRGWFGEIGFESNRALLLEAHGARKSATVRCTGAKCERASDLEDTVFPKAS